MGLSARDLTQTPLRVPAHGAESLIANSSAMRHGRAASSCEAQKILTRQDTIFLLWMGRQQAHAHATRALARGRTSGFLKGHTQTHT